MALVLDAGLLRRRRRTCTARERSGAEQPSAQAGPRHEAGASKGDTVTAVSKTETEPDPPPEVDTADGPKDGQGSEQVVSAQ